MTTTPVADGIFNKTFETLSAGDLLIFESTLFWKEPKVEIWWMPSGTPGTTLHRFIWSLHKNDTVALVVEPRGLVVRDDSTNINKTFWVAEVLVGENKYIVRIHTKLYSLVKETGPNNIFKVCYNHLQQQP